MRPSKASRHAIRAGLVSLAAGLSWLYVVRYVALLFASPGSFLTAPEYYIALAGFWCTPIIIAVSHLSYFMQRGKNAAIAISLLFTASILALYPAFVALQNYSRISTLIAYIGTFLVAGVLSYEYARLLNQNQPSYAAVALSIVIVIVCYGTGKLVSSQQFAQTYLAAQPKSVPHSQPANLQKVIPKQYKALGFTPFLPDSLPSGYQLTGGQILTNSPREVSFWYEQGTQKNAMRIIEYRATEMSINNLTACDHANTTCTTTKDSQQETVFTVASQSDSSPTPAYRYVGVHDGDIIEIKSGATMLDTTAVISLFNSLQPLSAQQWLNKVPK